MLLPFRHSRHPWRSDVRTSPQRAACRLHRALDLTEHPVNVRSRDKAKVALAYGVSADG